MTVRTFIAVSFIALLVGLSSLAAVVTQLDPEQAGLTGFVLFFLSVFVSVASASALAGFGVRRIIVRQQFAAYAVRTSLRQALTIGVFSSCLLFLQLLRLYRWWLALGIIALLACLEVVFLSYGASHNRHLKGTGQPS